MRRTEAPLAMVSLEPWVWPQTKPHGAGLVFSTELPAILPCPTLSLSFGADHSVVRAQLLAYSL